MSTTFYFRRDSTYDYGDFWVGEPSWSMLDGSTSSTIEAWRLASSNGTTDQVITAQTVAGPTAGREFNNGGTLNYGLHAFVSPPIDADVTVSGSITFNLVAYEGTMATNAAINCILYKIDGTTLAITQVHKTARTTELTTSATAVNFSETPTSFTLHKGDRLVAVLYIDDAAGVNMGSGEYCYFQFNNSTGRNSYIQFTETFTYGAEPTGSKLFLTDVASDVSTAAVDRVAWTSRDDGTVTDTRNHVNGPTAPIQMTDTAGGTVVDWWTPKLNGFTLGGAARVKVYFSFSSGVSTVQADPYCEIAVCDDDGSNPVVWAKGVYARCGRPNWSTGTFPFTFLISGDDVVVPSGKRLRIRIGLDDSINGNMYSTYSSTLTYGATSDGATGDTFVTFSQTLSEWAPVEGSFTANAIIRREQQQGFSVDAWVFGAVTVPFTADAIIRRPDQEGSFSVDAQILLAGLGSFTADAIVKRTITHAKSVFLQEYTFGTGGYASLRYRQSQTYSVAADYNGSGSYIQGGTGNPPQVGQMLNSSAYYFVGQMLCRFDLSSIPADATIVAARLHLDGHGDNSNVDFDIEIYKASFGSSTGDALFRTATVLQSSVLLGQMNSADWIYDTNINTRYWNYITLDETEIVPGGLFDLAIVSGEQVAESPPTVTTAGDEYVYPADDFYGEGPMLELTYIVGTPLTVDAWVARGGSFTADAVVKRLDQPGSFTVDAWVQGEGAQTVEKTVDVDAIIRLPHAESITADAVIKRNQPGSLTANAVIQRLDRTVTFSANAVIKRQQESSFGVSAWIYSPRQDPEGPGEPGETPMVSITVDGVDITADVLIADAQFTMLVNGAVGSFKFRVRDDEHTHDFTTGAEVALDIDGHRKFGGYLVKPTRGFAFPVQDTSVPGNVTRYWTLEGVDYNILFTKRVLYDKNDPASVELRKWTAGTHDDVIIKYVFDHYTDLPADGATYNGVDHIGSPNPDKTGVVGSGGLTFGDAMREINRLLSGVWYFDQFKDLHFVDVDTPDAPYGMSDNPGPGQVGFREFSQVESGTRLVNDAMVWGAGLGPRNVIAFGREQNAASQTAHGLWQYGEYTGNLYKQASVDLRADTVVNGTPQSKRGAKDDQESWSVITFEKSFAVGQKVAIESEVFNKSDVVPIRRMTITFPVRAKPMFMLTLSHEIDLPWNLFEFWFPPFQRPDIDIDIDGGGGDPPPPECPDPYDGFGYYGENGDWEWTNGNGDGDYAHKDSNPGWSFSNGVFTFVSAADPGAISNDNCGFNLVYPSAPSLFDWLRGGPFVITGSFYLPNTTWKASESSTASLGIYFHGGAYGGAAWTLLTGYAGQSLLENRGTLINYNPSEAADEPGLGSFGWHTFAFYCSPEGATIVWDTGTLSVPANGWDWSELDEIRFQVGEAPASSDGMVAGGTWIFSVENFARLDGTPAPWCGEWESPGSGETTNLVGSGTQTIFTLRSAYVKGTTMVFLDGLFQRPGIEYTESNPATGEITFTTAPASSKLISVRYIAIPGEI